MSNPEKAADLYSYRVFYSQEDESFVGLCTELPSISGFGDTPEEALSDVRFVAQGAVEWILEDAGQPPEPIAQKEYKGRISLRIPPDTHARIAVLAAEAGVSLNQYITSILDFSAGRVQQDRDVAAMAGAVAGLTKYVGQALRKMEEFHLIGSLAMGNNAQPLANATTLSAFASVFSMNDQNALDGSSQVLRLSRGQWCDELQG